MALITKVKAGSVSSLSDARFFAGMGVDWLGFDVNPHSDCFVNVELYKNIAGWVLGPERMAEINFTADASTVDRIISEYSPDCIEVDIHNLPPNKLTVPVFVRAQVSTIKLEYIKAAAGQIEYLVLDLEGAKPLLNKELISRIAQSVKVLLSIEPQITNAVQVVTELPIAGLSLKGSKEHKTGIKDYDYSDLLEALDDGN